MTAEELDTVLEPDMTLTIPTLSRLYRTVVLARALKLPVGDLLAFRDVFAQLGEPTDPFVADGGTFDTRATLRFIEEVRAVAEAGFSADELLYLLGHDAGATLTVGPSCPSFFGHGDCVTRTDRRQRTSQAKSDRRADVVTRSGRRAEDVLVRNRGGSV